MSGRQDPAIIIYQFENFKVIVVSLYIQLTDMLTPKTTTDDWVLWATVNDTLSYINTMMRFGSDAIEYINYIIVSVTKAPVVPYARFYLHF